jgi:opacity protein-like surface antigen
MNQKTFLGLLFVILLSICLSAGADDKTGTISLRFETGISSGLSPDLKLPNIVKAGLGKTMYFGGGAVYQIRHNLRADATITYRGGFEQNVEFGEAFHAKADFQSTAVMFNAAYEFSPWHQVIPYVSGGLGYVYNQLDQVSIVSSDGLPLANINPGGWANMGAQFGGGVSIPFHENWFVDVGYRYFDGGKYESDDVIHLATGVNQTFDRHVGNLTANELTVALRIPIY